VGERLVKKRSMFIPCWLSRDFRTPQRRLRSRRGLGVRRAVLEREGPELGLGGAQLRQSVEPEVQTLPAVGPEMICWAPRQ